MKSPWEGCSFNAFRIHRAGVATSVGLAALGAAWLQWQQTLANGVYRDGAGARSMALGGASTGLPDQPIEALFGNPAGLTLTGARELQLGGVGAFGDGEFASARTHDDLNGFIGGLPEFAVIFPMVPDKVAFGLAAGPEAAAGLDWRFEDATGGAGGATTYGIQRHEAEFIAIRTAAGASVKLGERWSLGFSVGATYNRNRLVSPYVFQSHPVLSALGFKTLLNLEADGWGVNGTGGLVYRATDQLSIGLSYRTRTHFETHGDANGNAGTQLQDIGLGGARPDFHYDAEVETVLPQAVSLGLSWQVHPRVRALAQIDWFDWSDSFDQLKIKLTQGNNADINGVLGSSGINDTVPLNWRDRFVYRTGVELGISSEWTGRLGYCYGENPIPESTFTPMSAAILEHTITTGVEWRRGRLTVAAAYQYSPPVKVSVATSGLRAGEFSNTRTKLEAHTFGLTTGFRF